MKSPRWRWYVVCAVCLLCLPFACGCGGGGTKPTPIPVGPTPGITTVIPTPTPTPPVHNTTRDEYYATIQEAIDDAQKGDTIVVSPGIYHENIDFKGKTITVSSEDPEDPAVVASTVIDGGGEGSVVTFKSGETFFTAIAGFTIQNGTGTGETWATALSTGVVVASNGGGIYIKDSSPTIVYNVIRNNRATSGGGIYIAGTSSPLIGWNTIEGNQSKAEGGGIAVWGNSAPLIYDNIIRNNQATGNLPVFYQFHFGHGGGIYVDESASARDDIGTPWPRRNCPPLGVNTGGVYTYQHNTFSGNTHLGGQETEGCHVYFK